MKHTDCVTNKMKVMHTCTHTLGKMELKKLCVGQHNWKPIALVHTWPSTIIKGTQE